MPCEGAVARSPSGSNSALAAGSWPRATSLRAAKSTTANPLKSDNCTKIRLVEPSGPASIAIGRMPLSSLTSHATRSVSRSMSVTLPVRTGHDVFAIGRHIDVVQPAVDRHALGQRQGRGVDNIERAGFAGNADH